MARHHADSKVVGPDPRYAAGDAYFAASKQLAAAMDERDLEKAAKLVHRCLDLLPPWLHSVRRDPRQFSSRWLPIRELEHGGSLLALVGDDEGLARMRRLVASEPALRPWIERVERHHLARRLLPRIENLIRTRPTCLQNDLKRLLDTPDGRPVASMVSFLETIGRLVRVRSGRTWRLLPPDSPEIPPADPQPEPPPRPPRPRPQVPSHRTDRTAPLRPVELSSLPRIALPQALAKWELVEKDRLPEVSHLPQASFEVRDADWRSASVERLPPALRPDPAIRRFFPSISGVVMTTERRRWTDSGSDDASALHCDHDGRITARRTLPHGLFRAYCPPFGSAVIGVSWIRASIRGPSRFRSTIPGISGTIRPNGHLTWGVSAGRSRLRAAIQHQEAQ